MDYTIPKNSTEVYICFDKNGEKCTYNVIIYLDQNSPHHSGTQTIDELLNDDNHFIPMIIKEEGGALSLFNIEMLNYVGCKEIEKQHSEQKFKVFFNSGESLLVNSCEILPEFHSRPIDYLNSHHRFLTFQYENRKIYINRKRIKRVTQL